MAGLFERDAELTALGDALAAAELGDGGVVLVEGAAGVGKSALLASVRERARGFSVFTARGAQLERDFPFGVVRQLFARDPGLDALDDASYATLDALYWLVLGLAERRPVLLVVDDLQWCDVPSLRFLAFLARRLEGARVLVVAGLRTGEAIDPLVDELAADPLTVAVRPRPLTADGVALVLVDAEPAFVVACEEATGGNPLLLRLLADALRVEGVPFTAEGVPLVGEIGSRAVSRTVALRLARVSADAVSVARAVAVLGSAEPEIVGALTGLDRAAVAAGLEALGDLIGPSGFVYPVVRDAVYETLSVVEREPLHVVASRVLRAAGAPRERIAAQLLHARPMGEGWAALLLREVGAAALAGGAPEAAVAYLARALEEVPNADDRASVLLALGEAESLTTAPGATAHLREAYASLPEAAIPLGRWLMISGGRAELDELLASNADGDVARELEALQIFGAEHGYAPRSVQARAAAHRALPSSSLASLRLAAVAAVVWSHQGAAASEVVPLALACLEDGRLLEADNAFMSYGAIVALLGADRDEALTYLDASLALARRTGSAREVYSAHTWRGLAMLARGEVAEAFEDLTQGHGALRLSSQIPAAWAYLESMLIAVHIERGDLAAARRVLDAGHRTPAGSDGVRFLLDAELALLAAEGEWAALIARADIFEREYAEWYVSPWQAHWRALKGLAVSRTGGDGSALIAAELDAARATETPSLIAFALRLSGSLDSLEEAVAVCEGVPAARLEHTRCLVAYGRALRLDRRPVDAREPLRRALDFASAHGAEALASVARAELEATGARPRRDVLSGVESLTPSERRVAEAAAGGASNREIARELYVTPKTVELHLTNAYRKLDIRSRRELPVALSG